MAQLTIQADDLAATLQAQRNEAWDAAARAGAALQAAGRRIDELEKNLELLKIAPKTPTTTEDAG